MIQLSAIEISTAVFGEITSGDGGYLFKEILTDSRSILPDCLFLAIAGENFDGYNFVENAEKAGAKGFIVSKPVQTKNPDSVVIQVKDTLKAYGDLANYVRNKMQAPVIGLTGTCGKTTTKNMIAHILRKHGNTLATEANYNNLVGVPLTLLKATGNEKYAVIEMGTNHFGEIARLTEIANPDIGLITNIGAGHLEFFKTVEGVAKAKSEIIDKMKPGSIFIKNLEDPLVANIKILDNINVKTYSFINSKADFYATSPTIFANNSGQAFNINNKYDIKIPLTGQHNAYNALSAIASVFTIGIQLEDCINDLEDFTPSKMRTENIKISNVTIINDCYNSNPTSAAASLENLSLMSRDSRKIAVLADMFELGEESAKWHHLVGLSVAQNKIDSLIAIGKDSFHTAQGAIEGGMSQKNIAHFDNTDSAANHLKSVIKKGDFILIKGSRGMKLEKLVDILTDFLNN